MGYAKEHLIPAAVLYKNAGITREEYAKILREIRWPNTISGNEEFEYAGGNYPSLEYKAGLFSVAQILGLKYTEEYKKYVMPIEDENELPIYSPKVIPIPRKVGGKFLDPEYDVIVHKENEIINPHKVVEIFRHANSPYKRFKPGEIICASGWEEEIKNAKWKILEILGQEFCPEEKDDDGFLTTYDDDGVPGDLLHAHLKVLEYVREEKILHFRDLDSLSEEYPLLHPNKIWDWSQEEGTLRIYLMDRSLNSGLHWIKRNEKYYLEFLKETKEQVYTNIIVSAAAIEEGAMAAFARQASEGHYWPQMIEYYPKIRQKNNDAIIDYWTAEQAIREQLSTTEWLKNNLLAIANLGEESSFRDNQM